MKTEWDRAGGGAHVIVGAEAVVDFIPTNRWLKRGNLSGRVAFMCLPREGVSRAALLLRANKDGKDLAMLVWCEFWVQVQNFQGHMVLGKG